MIQKVYLKRFSTSRTNTQESQHSKFMEWFQAQKTEYLKNAARLFHKIMNYKIVPQGPHFSEVIK